MQAQLLHRMQEGTFFSALEVDINTPPPLPDKFSEMTPIFKDMEIKWSQVGKDMQTFAEQHDIMTTPRRALIGSYKADKNLLDTPLLKFYLDQGLVVSRVPRAIQVLPSLARTFCRLRVHVPSRRRCRPQPKDPGRDGQAGWQCRFWLLGHGCGPSPGG